MVHTDDEEDDDVPVSALIARKQRSANTAAPVPAPSASAPKPAAASAADDSEDDLPIIEIIKRRTAALAASKQAKKPRPESNGKEKSSKRADSSSESDSSSEDDRRKSKSKSRSKDSERERPAASSSSSSSSRSKGNTSSAFYGTKKGALVQALLRRWWYAYDWPLPSEIGVPPAGYESLDGFPGVFVSTRTDSLGNLLDLRDKTNCPCLANFAKKSSSELQRLVTTAIDNQMKALVEAEGKNSSLLISLRSELTDLRGIDATKADHDARQYENAFTNAAVDAATT